MTDHDPHDQGAQEDATKTRTMRERMERDAEKEDIRWLMSSRRGRRIAWRVLEQCGVFRSTFDPDASTAAFREGQRNYGLRVLDLIHSHCPELYPAMLKERNDDSSTNDDAR